ncbi:MAG: hypothetical protein AABM31_03865 [Actinomycetota bacterium]
MAHCATVLVEPALQALAPMVLPSGLLSYELVEGDAEPRGESVRYSLIVLLGLLRAEQAGVAVPLATKRLRDAVDAALDRPEVTPGDVALRLWVESRADTGSTAALLERLERLLRSRGGLPAREGLELAWIVTGLAAVPNGSTRAMLSAALDQLLGDNLAASGLFRHFGATGRRRRFPNFATEIYSVLALAMVARQGLDKRALGAACAAADRLLELQLEDGGWPWLYDADRGTVVERYEVYSVHQHGMAPMALRELSEVSGDERYAGAASRGLPWLFGSNELEEKMAPLERGMTYRSIRRVAPADRLWLYANTATAATVGRSRRGRGRLLEVNRSCRPYELGWLVEAWADEHAGGHTR